MPFAILRQLPLVGVMLLATGLSAAEPEQPWSESFQMRLQDRDRTFVVRNGDAYLLLEKGDLGAPDFIAGKEVSVLAKFERTDGQRAYFFGLDRLVALADLEVWANRLEGDNLHLFGLATRGTEDGTIEIRVRSVVVGRSDQQQVDDRLAKVATDDFKGRLAVAAWAREQAETQGNDDWWRLSAETIIARTAEAAAEKANAVQDATLLSEAFAWAMDQAKDKVLAARLASQPWFVDQPQAIAAAKRLTALGFDRYQDVWRPRTESLTLQFEDEFAAIPWRDADAFYKLGRWVDRHSEDLPRARDLSFRCYQAGYRADGSHPGIRRELGLGAGGGGAEERRDNSLNGPYRVDDYGIIVGGPEGWDRQRPIEGDALWIDPQSDTAYIGLRLLRPDPTTETLDLAWDAALLTWRVRSAFSTTAEPVEAVVPSGQGRSLEFVFQEGTDLRSAQLILVYQPVAKVGVVLVASFLPEEAERARAALLDAVSKVTIPEAVVTVPTTADP